MTDSEQLAEIKSLIQHLVTDVEGLKSDVFGLKTDVSGLKTDVSGLKIDVSGLKTDVETLSVELTRTNDRVEIYQRSSQQVVNLAFGLIVAATAAIVVPAVMAR
jgi:chromosome segregation ATPase